MGWFEVDKGGLRQLLEGKDKSFILRELAQNCWDEPGVTTVGIFIDRIPSSPFVFVQVKDDAPEGFYDIRHAFTLFANTRKRKNAEARGRFNLGEKQVLALCREAVITTTTGQIRFEKNGIRKRGRIKTDAGSVFEASIRMTEEEMAEAVRTVMSFLPPKGIKTTINDTEIPYRKPKIKIKATLATEIEDDEGAFRPTKRKAVIEVHEPFLGEKAMLYEMGLPVIETGDKYHYNVLQRVPLTTDRDNVKPAFLQDVRAEVLNATVKELDVADASEQWVREAGEDDRTTKKAFTQVMEKRFGQKRVVADPGDPESKERAIAAGYTIVPPATLSKGEWAKARGAGAIPSSSQIFSTSYVEAETVSESDLTDDMRRVADLTRRVSEIGLGFRVEVEFVKSKASTAAQYGSRQVSYNLTRLGKGAWWRPKNREAQIELIVHEIGHEFGRHLSEKYYNGLSRIAARLALASPREFEV